MAPKFFHIIGTDTDVGKTYITHQLLHILNEKESAIPLKPVHSGWPKNTEIGEDLAFQQDFIQGYDLNSLCCYRFSEASSPNYAAKIENKTLELSKLDDFMNRAKTLNAETILVEGIGGLCCPLTEKTTYLDFVKRHPFPVIIVGRVGLGALNHMIMTCELLKRENIEIKAIVLNSEKLFADNDPIFNSVRWECEQQFNQQIIGPLPRDSREKSRELLRAIDFS